MHGCQRAYAVQIGGLGNIDTRLTLRDHHDGFILSQRIDKLHRALAAHRQRQHRVRKQDRVAHGQHRIRMFGLRRLGFSAAFSFAFSFFCVFRHLGFPFEIWMWAAEQKMQTRSRSQFSKEQRLYLR